MRSWPVLAMLVLAACSGSGDGQPRGVDREANRVEMEQVVEQVRAVPGVLEATGSWSGSLTTTGSTGVTATVADGTPEAEQQRVADRAAELVWRSRVDPVSSLSILVLTPSTPPDAPGLQLRYDRAERFAELEQAYGPRPVG